MGAHLPKDRKAISEGKQLPLQHPPGRSAHPNVRSKDAVELRGEWPSCALPAWLARLCRCSGAPADRLGCALGPADHGRAGSWCFTLGREGGRRPGGWGGRSRNRWWAGPPGHGTRQLCRNSAHQAGSRSERFQALPGPRTGTWQVRAAPLRHAPGASSGRRLQSRQCAGLARRRAGPGQPRTPLRSLAQDLRGAVPPLELGGRGELAAAPAALLFRGKPGSLCRQTDNLLAMIGGAVRSIGADVCHSGRVMRVWRRYGRRFETRSLHPNEVAALRSLEREGADEDRIATFLGGR